VFDLQDRVAVSVAGVIEPALQAAEMRRSAARPTTDLSTYDLYLRALAAYFPITRQRIFEALVLLEQAIAIDGHYGPALSVAAICHLHLTTNGWVEEAETVRRRASDLALQALQVGENDPGILVNAAFVLARFGEDVDATIGLVDRALALNPSYARGWLFSGILRSWAGQHNLAIEHLETSRRLSPHERMGQPLVAMGMAYFMKHQFDEAATRLLLSIQDHPGYPQIINKAMSLVVVASALPFRAAAVPFASVAAHGSIIVNLLAGSLLGAWFGASWATRLASHTLYRIIAALFVMIAVVLVIGHDAAASGAMLTGAAQMAAGVVAGLVIGVVAALLGVAGGELLIPTLILLFGADIKLAGSLSLAVSLPTMLVGFARYSRDRSFVVLGENRRFVLVMAVGSIFGSFIGGQLLGLVPNAVLLPLLAIILVLSAVKVWGHK
jgi:uncharacterized membrane protein YfcA